MKPSVFCALAVAFGIITLQAVAFGIITLQSVKSHHAHPEKSCHQGIEVVPYPGP